MNFWNLRKAEPRVCSRKQLFWLSSPVSSISASLKRSDLVSKSKRTLAASGSTTRSLIYWKPTNPACRLPLHRFVRLTRAASPKISSHGAPTSQSSSDIYQPGKCSLRVTVGPTVLDKKQFKIFCVWLQLRVASACKSATFAIVRPVCSGSPIGSTAGWISSGPGLVQFKIT